MSKVPRSGPIAVAVIPARGGSKGLPDKNMRTLGGRPLIWYTIQAAVEARAVDRVFVSTEDDRVAAYAASVGAEVLRHPATLSADDASTFPVIQWDVQELRRQHFDIGICVVLRATTPFRSASDIDHAIQLLIRHPKADSVVSVRPAVGIHPMRLKRILEDGRIVDAFMNEGAFPVRRQVLEPLYLRNGGIYAAKVSVIDAGGLWGKYCLPYIMPEHRSVNINTEFDFTIAELLVRGKNANAESPQQLG